MSTGCVSMSTGCVSMSDAQDAFDLLLAFRPPVLFFGGGGGGAIFALTRPLPLPPASFWRSSASGSLDASPPQTGRRLHAGASSGASRPSIAARRLISRYSSIVPSSWNDLPAAALSNRTRTVVRLAPGGGARPSTSAGPVKSSRSMKHPLASRCTPYVTMVPPCSSHGTA